MTYKVAIFLFPNIETLDFCGPLEVFTAANIVSDDAHFEVFTFAETLAPLRTINGLSVNPDYDFNNVPVADILVIPGGNGSRDVIKNPEALEILLNLHNNARLTFSVCSGARILAVLGLLNNREFTTHHLVFDDVQLLAPTAVAMENKRFTDNGNILTSAGVAAGIDLSLYLVEKLKGKELKQKVTRYMEYEV